MIVAKPSKQITISRDALLRTNHLVAQLREMARRSLEGYEREKRLLNDALRELAFAKGVNPIPFARAWRSAKLHEDSNQEAPTQENGGA